MSIESLSKQLTMQVITCVTRNQQPLSENDSAVKNLNSSDGNTVFRVYTKLIELYNSFNKSFSDSVKKISRAMRFQSL